MDLVIEKITLARVGLLLRHPFFGNMAVRLKIEENNEWCKTAATDGRKFYYNREFIDQLSHKKVEFLFAHEVLHCVFDHFGRLGHRNRQLANIAQDFAVNQILVDERIGEVITEVKICQDNKYRGKAWEEIYDELLENADMMSAEQLLEMLAGSMSVLDDHLSSGEDFDQDGDEESDGRPKISKEDLEQIRNEIQEAMINAASHSAGKLPAGVERLIKSLTEPKMNWRDVLQMNIQSVVRNDYSFSRPNRKSWQTGTVLPGLVPGDTVEVAVFIDMSGSISFDDAAAFLSEVKGIMDQYHDFRIEIASFDTAVYNHVVITHDNADDILSYQPKGGGGTDFMACWEFLKENDIVPKRMIMFTDGYPCGSWGDPDYCETLFIVKGNTAAQAPFGQLVIYESLG